MCSAVGVTERACPPRLRNGGKFLAALESHDTRYWEKPYYLVPDGDEADEGYAIMQRALAETGKVAIGQLIMGGRAHLVDIKALEGGLMLSILRYADELRDFTPYFEGINTKPEPEAVGLAKELI
jgi:DNA end-binding protein Ku